ncbi:transporter [Cronobacter turicensis]|nr:transporter [Cronobacter turicensis]MDI7418784.1 transporter [Cronobacter turicensis]MDI7497188.1 transporter [Cronobacter turicensis]
MTSNGIRQGMSVSETVFIEKPMMMCNHFFIIRKIATACLFLLVSWALLHLWLILIHSIDERVAATLLSSPIIFICMGVTVFSVLAQKQAGVAQAWYIMTLGLVLAFIILILLFSVLLNTLPDLNDLVFYYECFLILFFTGSPLYLFIRML